MILTAHQQACFSFSKNLKKLQVGFQAYKSNHPLFDAQNVVL